MISGSICTEVLVEQLIDATTREVIGLSLVRQWTLLFEDFSRLKEKKCESWSNN